MRPRRSDVRRSILWVPAINKIDYIVLHPEFSISTVSPALA
jgi:hypothetical protein